MRSFVRLILVLTSILTPFSPASFSYPVKVGGDSLCGRSAPNQLCTSVTLCSEEGVCQDIPEMLVDTGSVGVRMFASLITIPVKKTSFSECATFGMGASWGPVVEASVKIGKLQTGLIPIQLIDSEHAVRPWQCGRVDHNPEQTGFNGILGIGPFLEDCGNLCTQVNSRYYMCEGSSCEPIGLPLSAQLQNPIAHFGSDQNGFHLKLPSPPRGGCQEMEGSLEFGVRKAKLIRFPMDSEGMLSFSVEGRRMKGWLDTGSNAFFLQALPSVPRCLFHPSYFCPPKPLVLSASFLNPSSRKFWIPVENPDETSARVLEGLVGSFRSHLILGLPFFFGREVVLGLENKQTPFGRGPFWAF